MNPLVLSGRFFFRFRNFLFPIVFLSALLVTRPHPIGSPQWDHFLASLGVAVALLGEGLRLFTIGFDYIDRGGKNRQVAASRLVEGGMYGCSRNPMYVANMLIVVGFCMLMGSPAAYIVIAPFFLFVYLSIVAAEEEFLQKQFGSEYTAYCRRVPRFLPKVQWAEKAFAGMKLNLQKSIRQDLSTIATVFLGVTLLPFWRQYFLQGQRLTRPEVSRTAFQLAVVLSVYVFLIYLKKTKKYFYSK